ncbi:glycosyltransferase [Hyphobacterium marinum]|uniref:Glycosyltransferase n=1 Tax=Hyphobacterium marinum TaxID=3116574 RepID=A0ABU7LY70_9PROT|nr:glycosyltransferase [Hyphobacterium sp. Y6023]MEE2566480.1 glycosyltransferase [Hyphobacterium sp. Y6023]
MSRGGQLDILVFNSIGNSGVPSFLDHIGMFGRYSRHRCFYHNFVYQFDPEMDFSKFDAVVFTHNFWLPALSEAQRKAIHDIKALKVLFLQDEFQYLRTFNAIMGEMGINLMFTCAAERDFDQFYPKKLIPSLREVHQNLTGYVTDALMKPGLRARGPRRWDVGYRGRAPIYYMGLLGQHKLRIAEEFTALCEREGFTHNISYQEDDRLSGRHWFDFLRSTRVQLGSPSGTSIVDLDGSLIEAEQKYRAEKPHATFDEVYKKILKPHEGKMKIDTVSPRHFEYAATGATMVMIEGDYGGYLKPDEHYIPVAPDYSNLDAVAAKIRNRKLCREVADRAHAHLIESGDFSAEKFVRDFDTIIERHAKPKMHGDRPDIAAFNAVMTEKFNQVLFFGRMGHAHIRTGEGQRLRRETLKSHVLSHTPVVGPILRQTGGDPLMKLAKGRAALRMASAIPDFRELVAQWARNPEQRALQTILFPEVLKSILLLGLVKAAQSGAAPYGEGFHVRPVLEDDFLALIGEPADPGVPAAGHTVKMAAKDARKIEAAISRGLDGGIRLDLSRRWPIKLFGHSTLFAWSVEDKQAFFRSSSDEYFHLSALSKISRYAPQAAASAVFCALRPASGREVAVLEKAFNLVLPESLKTLSVEARSA